LGRLYGCRKRSTPKAARAPLFRHSLDSRPRRGKVRQC
jgi:hypothetical protein